nr:hypothetical protein [Desulfobacterales bacterium]
MIAFGRGQEKRIYTIPPFTQVGPPAFKDIPSEVRTSGRGTMQSVRSNRRLYGRNTG